MKKIFFKTGAFTFLAASMLAACTSDSTTGVESEGMGTESNIESQPNMGGKTGNTAGLDSIATEEGDTTNRNNMDNQQ